MFACGDAQLVWGWGRWILPCLLPGSWGVIQVIHAPYHSCYQSNLQGAGACAAFPLSQLHAFFRLFSHAFCRVRSEGWPINPRALLLWHRNRKFSSCSLAGLSGMDCLVLLFQLSIWVWGHCFKLCCLQILQGEQFCFVRREKAASFRVKCSQGYSELLTNAIVWLKKSLCLY